MELRCAMPPATRRHVYIGTTRTGGEYSCCGAVMAGEGCAET